MTTFLDVVRKGARERRQRDLIMKGSKGSGWYAPPKGTHGAKVKAGAKTGSKARKKTPRRMTITREIKNDRELEDTLRSLSLEHGGAWVFSVKPFSHTVNFERFQSPSKVPDHYHDLTRNTMAYEGKIRGFTEAAVRRERNRGLSRT